MDMMSKRAQSDSGEIKIEKCNLNSLPKKNQIILTFLGKIDTKAITIFYVLVKKRSNDTVKGRGKFTVQLAHRRPLFLNFDLISDFQSLWPWVEFALRLHTILGLRAARRMILACISNGPASQTALRRKCLTTPHTMRHPYGEPFMIQLDSVTIFGKIL
jgi:hypothetical protein